jgi:hypothetical protein
VWARADPIHAATTSKLIVVAVFMRAAQLRGPPTLRPADQIV